MFSTPFNENVKNACFEIVNSTVFKLEQYFRDEWKHTKLLKVILLRTEKKSDNTQFYCQPSSHKLMFCDVLWCDNENVTLDFILSHQELEWDWNRICANNQISIHHYKQYPHIPWNKRCFNNSPDLTLTFILEHQELTWDWGKITVHKNITMDDIENNMNLPWIFWIVCENPNLTTDFVLKYHQNKDLDWTKIKKHDFAVEQTNYIDSNISKLLLCFILCGYEMNEHNALPFANLDYIFADNYLVKNIVQFL